MADIINGVHEASEEEKYVKPSDTEVLKRLEWCVSR
jgi:hypothetical protein